MSYASAMSEVGLSIQDNLEQVAARLAERAAFEASRTTWTSYPQNMRVTVELDPHLRPAGQPSPAPEPVASIKAAPAPDMGLAHRARALIEQLIAEGVQTHAPGTLANDVRRLEAIACQLAEIEARHHPGESSRRDYGMTLPSIEMAFQAMLDIHRRRLRPPTVAREQVRVVEAQRPERA